MAKRPVWHEQASQAVQIRPGPFAPLVPPTGAIKAHVPAQTGSTEPVDEALINIVARIIEVIGSREKVIRWLRTPVLALGDKTPMSLLSSEDGRKQVETVLGRIEHGIY